MFKWAFHLHTCIAKRYFISVDDKIIFTSSNKRKTMIQVRILSVFKYNRVVILGRREQPTAELNVQVSGIVSLQDNLIFHSWFSQSNLGSPELVLLQQSGIFHCFCQRARIKNTRFNQHAGWIHVKWCATHYPIVYSYISSLHWESPLFGKSQMIKDSINLAPLNKPTPIPDSSFANGLP